MHHEHLPVFVYGTLQRGEERAAMWPCEPVEVERAIARGRLFDLGSYPALAPGDDLVRGELWHVHSDDLDTTLRALDEIECYGADDVDLYVREVIECSLDGGGRQRAYAYFIANSQDLKHSRPVAAGADGICHWRRRAT